MYGKRGECYRSTKKILSIEILFPNIEKICIFASKSQVTVCDCKTLKIK